MQQLAVRSVACPHRQLIAVRTVRALEATEERIAQPAIHLEPFPDCAAAMIPPSIGRWHVITAPAVGAQIMEEWVRRIDAFRADSTDLPVGVDEWPQVGIGFVRLEMTDPSGPATSNATTVALMTSPVPGSVEIGISVRRRTLG